MALIDINGVRLSADERGNGESVLFVGGTGQQAAMWEMFGRAEIDHETYRTIVFDHRGIPPSEVPEPPYSMQMLADDTVGIIEHFDAAPCHLIGASLGANIVFTVALQRPKLVASAAMVVGGGNFRPEMVATMRAQQGVLGRGGEEARQAQLQLILEATLTPDQRNDPALVEAGMALAEGFLPQGDDWTGALGQMAANLDWGAHDHLLEATQITVPCLILANEFDFGFDPEVLRATADRIPDCVFHLFEGQPHMSMDPDVVAETTRRCREFLAAHPRS